jgi:hypothetical protein
VKGDDSPALRDVVFVSHDMGVADVVDTVSVKHLRPNQVHVPETPHLLGNTSSVIAELKRSSSILQEM